LNNPEDGTLNCTKNRWQNAFERIVDAFEADLKITAAKAAKRDLAGSGKSFGKAEEKCSACHAKFRD
jgi:cytochrome c556